MDKKGGKHHDKDRKEPEPVHVSDMADSSEGRARDGQTRERMSEKAYQKELLPLHVELVKLQQWVQASGTKVSVVFEGRDGAGKGGTIKAKPKCRVSCASAAKGRNFIQINRLAICEGNLSRSGSTASGVCATTVRPASLQKKMRLIPRGAFGSQPY